MGQEKNSLLLLLLLLVCCRPAAASLGDRSWAYNSCLQPCRDRSCPDVEENASRTGVWPLLSCEDECKYKCMWIAVQAFEEEGEGVPQFHGRWPFLRLLGLQEPASCLFSLLNLAAHAVSLWAFRRRVSPHAPFYLLVHLFAVVCMNAWVWSAIFHAHDTGFTERMDYLCAFSVLLSWLLLLGLRLSGTEPTWRWGLVWLGCLVLLAYHAWYLLSGSRFDYGYNMRLSLAIGAANGAGWLLWWTACRRRCGHAWKAALFVLLLAATTLLEVMDFPPVLWLLDAHALWHLATAPLPPLWYSFLADDCLMHLEEKAQFGLRKKV